MNQIHDIPMAVFWENFDFFPLENGFSGKKVQKNWKSKNGVKTALTPLFKELWAILVKTGFNTVFLTPKTSKKMDQF